MRERTYGLLIRRVDYSETSQIVSFFTPDFGLVQAMARGARREKNPFQSALDLLALGEILFIPKSQGLSILTEFYLEENFSLLRKDLKKYYSACYVVEILRIIAREELESSMVYYSTLQILKKLEGGVAPSLCLCLFDIHILDFLGVFPNIKSCLFCERDIKNVKTLFFSLPLGGVVCSYCKNQDQYPNQNLQKVSLATLKIIDSLKRADLSSIQTISIPREKIKEIEGFLHKSLYHFLERKPFSLKFL